MERLFPFRSLPRDVAIFLRRSLHRGGGRALYSETARDSRKVLERRGYYFISGQSTYPNDRLSDDFQLRTDTPHRTRTPRSAARNSWYHRLMRVLEQHHIRAYLAPVYYRENECAARDCVEEELARFLAGNPCIEVIDGPAYMLYPNHLFADPVHLNQEGARRYTEELWGVFSRHLKRGGTKSMHRVQTE